MPSSVYFIRMRERISSRINGEVKRATVIGFYIISIGMKNVPQIPEVEELRPWPVPCRISIVGTAYGLADTGTWHYLRKKKPKNFWIRVKDNEGGSYSGQ